MAKKQSSRGIGEQEKNSTLKKGWKDPFFRLPNEIIDHPEDCPPLSMLQFSVYVVLCRYANSTGTAFPSYQKIADGARCTRRAVISAVAYLESVGLLEKEIQHAPNGDFTANNYTIFLPSQLREKDEKSSAPDGEVDGERETEVVNLIHQQEPEVVNEIHHPSEPGLLDSERRSLIKKVEEEGFRKNKEEEASSSAEDRKAKAETLTPELKASIAAAVARIQRAGKTSTMQDVFQPLLE